MKFFISKLMLVLVVGFVFTPFAFSQDQQQDAPASNNAPASTVAAGDDKLPFMQHEETSQPDSVSTGGIILKTFGAMLLIVGLIFFGAWGLKKFGFGPRSSANSDAPELTIVSTVTVGSGRTISSIKFGNRVLLVGSTPQSFTLLADGADDDPFGVSATASAPAGPRSVAEMLAAEDLGEGSFANELAKADAGFSAAASAISAAASGGRS